MVEDTVTKSTFCRICEAHCPLLADIDHSGRVMKLRPDRDHPVARGFACHKGLSFLQVHNDPDRLDHPLRRGNPRGEATGRFEPIGWDEALAQIGARIRELQAAHGADSVAVYMGNPIGFNSRALPGAASFGRQLGSRHTFSANTQDLANKYAAFQLIFGSHAFPIPDLDHTDLFICFGSNPKVSKGNVLSRPHLTEALKAIRQRGGDSLFINPRRIESAGGDCGEVLQIRPDTDVYLMAALLSELDRLGAWRGELLERGKHVDGLRDFVHRFPPARVSAVTGIAAGEITALAERIAHTPAVAFYMGTGVNQGRQGTLAFWLLNMLALVTGNLASRGGIYRPRGGLRGRPLQPQQPIDTAIGPVQPSWGCLPGNLLAELIEHPSRPIRALINLSGNPLLTMSGEERLRSALGSLDLIVSIDLYRNDTGEISDYLLPACDWIERDDINYLALGLQPQPFIQYSDALEPPAGERRNDGWILSRLMQAISGAAEPADDGIGFIRKILAQNGSSLEAMRDAESPSLFLDEGAADHAASLEEIVRHADGLIDCCPPQFAAALAGCEALLDEMAQAPVDQLQLISLRTNYMHNSWLANMPQMRQGRHALNPLHMHPEDADRRGLADGAAVRIHNGNGEVEATLRLDPALRPGVVAMSHGYGHRAPALALASRLPGSNVNRLLPSGPGSFEALSGMSWMNGIEVEVAAAL